VGGTLYGTTLSGGSVGSGTVFSITTGGAEKVLHSFGKAKTDGKDPYAGLIDVGGRLYSTTQYGGTTGNGTIFSITPLGAERVRWSFEYGSDGAQPFAGLLDVGGLLYGTTSVGGAYNGGTVFSATTGGTEKVLHSFDTSGSDGFYPLAGLINVGGTLYGTTNNGGPYGSYGTVFSITTGGKEKVLHSFGSGSDGAEPEAGLIDVRGTLYGTTYFGGTYSGGTVFSLTTGGKEKVLHSFGNGSDGANPTAGLIHVGGVLYGTTAGGGAYSCGASARCGTVFSITTGGTERVLHSFGKGHDGMNPFAGLIDVGGTLYGTTAAGGAHNNGTVFTLTP
jgi:uncharacterized repeat protein (TIGR03803 family)